MAFSIEDIKAKLEFGGARPSQFNVVLTLPDALQYAGKGVFNNKIEFLCRAASIPVTQISSVEVPYFGRKIKLAGNRTFPEWQITILNDEDFALRDAFEFWMNAINDHRGNLRGDGITSRPSTYKTTALVRHYAVDGDPSRIRKYKFEGVFPSEVSPIELNWASENEIEEFTVTLQYDIWTPDNTQE